jgi:anti-sigma B factor antagonist
MTAQTEGILDVDTWYDHGRAVVELSGELDAYTSAKLRRMLEELSTPGRHRVVVEMSGLDFMDSSGLGVLVGVMKRARTAGGALALAGCSDRILRVLRITGLVRVMVPFETLEQALAHVDQESAHPGG